MKNLLIEEMKRAIRIMEKNKNLKVMKDGKYGYPIIDRETTELKQLFLAIRKHSILLEKEIN